MDLGVFLYVSTDTQQQPLSFRTAFPTAGVKFSELTATEASAPRHTAHNAGCF